MTPDCGEVLQQDGRRLFCDMCGFESVIPERPKKKEPRITLREQVTHLSAEVERLREAVVHLAKSMDAIYNHNEAARAAVIQHYGLHHSETVRKELEEQ